MSQDNRVQAHKQDKLPLLEFCRRAIALPDLRRKYKAKDGTEAVQRGVHGVYSGFHDLVASYYGWSREQVIAELKALVAKGELFSRAAKGGPMYYLTKVDMGEVSTRPAPADVFAKMGLK